MTKIQLKKFNFLLSSQWIIITYAVLGLIGILNHTMWRDEMNAWLIVRDSHSFSELIQNIHYDRGHPALWHLLIALLKNIANTPMVMQIFHFAIGISLIIIFWLYSPFTKNQKILFTFGYFPFAEYLLISRNYSLGILFLFAFCTLYSSRRQTYLILAILLGLMANTNIFILFVAMALTMMLAVEFLVDPQQRELYSSNHKKIDLILSISLLIALYIFAIYIISPPADSPSGVLGEYTFNFDLRHFLKAVGKIFSGYTLIIPSSKRLLDLWICGIIGILITIIISLKFIKKPLLLVFYNLAILEIFLFTYFKYIQSSPRHFGHYYFIFLATAWLASYYQENKSYNPQWLNYPFINWLKKSYPLLFTIILSIHFLGGIYHYSRDLLIPLSASKATANFIQQSNLQNEFIVASRDSNVAAISGYLNRKLYYPELQDMGGGFLFLKAGRQEVTHDEVLRQVSSLLKSQSDRDRILLILHKKLKSTSADLIITPLKNFEHAYFSDERYYLYWVTLK